MILMGREEEMSVERVGYSEFSLKVCWVGRIFGIVVEMFCRGWGSGFEVEGLGRVVGEFLGF